ncbi:hypothetical protein AABM38_14130 [Heyndrickxia sp. MSNUG]|uniref:hypothetical protein n=1 Tax=Heyndrickxia sp. MSNUG TaxID=3136677 RepID=UPI003C2C47E8
MDQNQPGNEKLPDFKEMSDRIFINPYSGPQLVVKTNLDPNDATDENPYFKNDNMTDPQQFKEYFKE